MSHRAVGASLLLATLFSVGCATAPPQPWEGPAGSSRRAPDAEPRSVRAEPPTPAPAPVPTPVAVATPPSPETAPGAAAAPAAPARPADARAWHYVLMIDASSSASTLEIFRWHARDGSGLPVIETATGDDPTEPWRTRVKPGLAAYAGRPAEAAKSLEPLWDYALGKLGSGSPTTRTAAVHLRATAGMRLLPEAEQAAILDAVRAALASSPFGSSSARVITGAEEGIYGWLTVNYVLGHLEHGGPFPTVGALDLGGASTQITFQPLDYPRDNGQMVHLGRNAYHLYTRSYLGLGQDEARERVNSPDCFLAGYPMPDGRAGRGNYDACGRAIRAVLAVPCSEDDEPCSLLDGDQPPVYGEFLAFSVYAYAADYFDLDQRLRPAELAAAGRAFCATDWPAWIVREPAIADDPFVPNYCFAAAHIEALLTDGFGFPADTERITAPLRVQGTPIGWTLGALVHELAGR